MISYVGGKYYMTDWIINNFPKGYRKMCYVEVFGGMGWVLLKKELSKVEVFNDINGDVVNLFLQLRDNSKQMLRKLYYTPYSREYFKIAKEKYIKREFENDIERAIIFVSLLKMSFASNMKALTYSYTKKIPHNMIPVYKRAQKYVRRLRYVNIENMDFRDLIQRYDGLNTLFYLDPPYYKTEDYYEGNFNENDHKDLADLLKNIRGKFIVSYYPCEIVDKYYSDYNIISRKYVKRSYPTTSVSGKTKMDRGEELLIMNYEPEHVHQYCLFAPEKKNGNVKIESVA